MLQHHVNNFPPGTYVEHTATDWGSPWVGTVKRITVNHFGEPILVVDRAYLTNGEVVEDTVHIHPNNIRRLDEKTLIRR